MSEPKPDKLRILIVDDNRLNLMVMKHMFNFNDYEVHFAETGGAALEMARKYFPHLILLDVVMPDISGFDVCRTIKQDVNLKDTSIIFISAANEIDFKIRAFESGGIDFITKPFRKEEILQRVANHTSRKLSQAQLQNTTHSLQEIRNLQNRLFLMFGNDLRSSVADIRLIFEFISKELVDPTKDEAYKKNILDLLTSVDKSFSALENLRDWAVAENNKLKSEPENINLKEAVISLVNLYQHEIQLRDIGLTVEIDETHVVFADQIHLKTIIRNLFSNAYKYTASGGTISFRSSAGQGFVKISVSDTGLGMAPEILEKVLDPNAFFSTRGLNNEIGNGLGLKLCKDFVEKNQGRIWIESRPQNGTTVFFTLPAKNQHLIIEDTRSLIW